MYQIKTYRKALFLDRDGVININHGYVHHFEDFEFIDGIFALCKHAQRKGYQIIIITNQSGIARKYYSRKDFETLTKQVKKKFWHQGIKVTQTLYCPHHPDFNHTCICRKPKAGMIFKAKRRFHISLSKSVMVGDSISDMRCAQLAKIKKRILVTHDKPIGNGPPLKRPGNKTYYQTNRLSAIHSIL
ncbi:MULTISPECIES: D-glycero-beta-D-manno-heptose 1,7-bisphosphate 7-phosphatase [unclassified Oleiphilus]|uniref:D-glycero-beta-D-manno-heptose 1,7-bisphosphate 7-phosphatase n=1 Tax=unclassified Oleiphilus TaxID=2631174 RepID=UPI0007C2D629|nr:MULTISPECIES: D-glycero-beta-D-manno-heptose 1,7-bisphosphate 7-phosphatase [unclassified Oleiphilus]KZZ37193.1 hypothetical protein A3757_12215 [Oleiphilus sp. HI0117]KZZ53090.1 hypothetical protein A3761_18250 [Oleiphilus sp. HI0123]